jgi:UDP-N-acetyl-D-mannosaminuronate dehydrogenase
MREAGAGRQDGIGDQTAVLGVMASTAARATSRTSPREVGAFVGEGLLSATTDMSRLAECDAISICVPTPLSKIKDPDLSYVVGATRAVRRRCARAS